MGKPRLLCLLHRLPPAYGVTLLNEEILRSKKLREEFDIDSIAINTARSLEKINRNSPEKIFYFLKIAFSLIGKLFRHRYALCYMSLTPSGPGFVKDCVLVFFVKIFRIPIVFHIHGEGISSQRGALQTVLYRWCLRKTVVILPVRFLQKDVLAFIDSRRIIVLSNAVKECITEADLLEKEERDGHIPVLVCLSNMVRSKGIFVALEAASLLAGKGVDFRLKFAGQWYDISEDEFNGKVRALGLESKVEYLGFLKEEEKYKMLSEADIFVYPTLKDIFGLVNIEAMQCALPVISAVEGGIPEVVIDGVTGYLVEKNNPPAVAEKVELLIKDRELRKRMGNAGRMKYRESFSFERFEDKLTGILLAEARK